MKFETRPITLVGSTGQIGWGSRQGVAGQRQGVKKRHELLRLWSLLLA